MNFNFEDAKKDFLTLLGLKEDCWTWLRFQLSFSRGRAAQIKNEPENEMRGFLSLTLLSWDVHSLNLSE
jgi:hypothetical protein